MQPSLQYVSFNREGNRRNYGLIELKDLSWALDAAHLLRQSALWTEADANGLQGWCSALLR